MPCNTINTNLRDRNYLAHPYQRLKNYSKLVNSLFASRNLFNIQTVEYDLLTVTSLDIDETNNFILVGLSNGSVDLQEIEDPTYGNIAQLARFNFGKYNANRVQWNPDTSEQFFSILDNHVLHIIDPIGMRALEKYEFDMKTNWSEWNASDRSIIAICGSESQVRLVDLRSGSSAQTVILGAPSGLSTHRATRCLWSKHDTNCIFVGDNEGYIHVYDTRHSSRPLSLAGEERGQISGMSFATDQFSIITSQGTENNLIQWTYDKCKLRSNPKKFKKREKSCEVIKEIIRTESSSGCSNRKAKFVLDSDSKLSRKKLKKRSPPLPVSAYIRCQFHVAQGHIFCPVSSSTRKSKEIYIYDLETGDRVKTIKSNDILGQGVYSVSSLLPESLVIYVGGRGRLRVWSIDEGYQRKLEEKMNQYHRTTWDSDEEP